ncbi:flagellar protein FlaG [Oceanobacillus sp. 143]|jgi:flagellar protein FlaG|uniref:Flagellar biosynthesis protein FlaG n=1 Tax=Oceanobacillus zhaokaii TaxID=2052660 RepID=A0A345PJ34_9BACI|nr:flagellar protein FlaG [Oceanobacillus zhaokaii]AXI10014.1 flagellar biosynthesis protein FlaG [Oceanobacillus zhaokaii]QGS69176.1 flagellar protein FlaG [Oceanobacillus sp. 143]
MEIDNIVNGANHSTAEFSVQHNKASEDYTTKLKSKDIDQEDLVIDKQDIEQKIASFNEFLQPVRTNLKFELHEKLDRYYVSVVDSVTHEVIKEIPPKKMLDMYAELADFMGFLVDKRI